MPAWERLADVLLHREAALCRIVQGVPPRDFAGLFIGREDVDTALRGLPGLDGPDPGQAHNVREAFARPIREARVSFRSLLAAGDDVFTVTMRRAGLAADEAEVLAVLAAVEMHPQRQRLVAYVQDSVQLPRLTLPTLARIFGRGHCAERALAPAAGLRRAELAVVDDAPSWAARMAGAAERLVWGLRGDPSPDPALPAGAWLLPPLGDGPDRGPDELLLVHGADRDSRVFAVRRRYPEAGCLVVPVATTPEQWAAVVREATISGLTVVVELSDPLGREAADRIAAAPHLRWALSSPEELPIEALPRRRWQECEVSDGTASAEDWAAYFPGSPVPETLRLSREQLRHVAAACDGDSTRLAAGLRRLAGGHLEKLAVRVRPQRTWVDLVLPVDTARQLSELAARHRHRETVHRRWGFPAVPSTGIVALFAGPSGTGKTLAAEIIAADLGLDMYKVDLSLVVSKWIGETEKNLGRIFDAAAAGDLVLFFDEADALFGKRSEVSDAHDRYANIEVAYLLQRLESYDGLVILATNLQRNMDPAFLRRIAVGVDFASPDEERRREIWRTVFPRTAPVADLDFDFLARQFKVTGGVIANAARTAAFLAADAGAPISMEHVALALKREYQKLGRMRSEAEFAGYYPLVSRQQE